ncbi:hypothetical protein [Streptomyces melanogenes]|uniref:hypothetical protein n=1 Tax=Streptomyces melanogenes TaxID=67326 RepID=UPI00167C7FF6|nr:hypothetical protein [Streptomyces melanogenes]
MCVFGVGGVAEELFQECQDFDGQFSGPGYHGPGIRLGFNDRIPIQPLQSLRAIAPGGQIVFDEDAVSAVDQIARPIARHEGTYLSAVQLVHAQNGIQATILRILCLDVVRELDPWVPLEVPAAGDADGRGHACDLAAPLQQVFEQGITIPEALLPRIDVEGQHMSDGPVGPVQPVGRVEPYGAKGVGIGDALGIDDAPDSTLVLDDELALRVDRQTPTDDPCGDPQFLGPTHLFQLHEPGEIGQAGTTNGSLVLAKHRCGDPSPECRALHSGRTTVSSACGKLRRRKIYTRSGS